MPRQTPIDICIDEHPLLRVAPFITRFPAPLADLETPPGILNLLRADAEAPLRREEALRLAVRELLRYGGHRPSGRGKPASEYLVRAAEEGTLGSINLAVDLCNVVSLHSGFPIGVVDRALSRPPYRIAIGKPGTSYVFNPAGQEIALGGLVCLFDAHGACINPVRDSQRTKTRPETVETLTVIWAPGGWEDRLREAERWYRDLLEAEGAHTESVATTGCTGDDAVDTVPSRPAESRESLRSPTPRIAR
jgi:hypothetical protein